ncbi:hypothetical protein [Paenibacillus marchantiophytorum]|uniref:hypothetical protein n=1 Tax=Paenibacillus marchantiophytorum TaxID=1619310 RepID=UPI0016697838
MDMIRGREIGRNYYQDQVSGHKVMGGILRLSQSAPPADSLRMAKSVLNDSNIIPRGEKVLNESVCRYGQSCPSETWLRIRG